ncbi:MAG: hypothetical protein IT480_06540 [Gammaproteobacteria bacterium]|nr:hypothetical protein [Gammaproteobacteria bacterium]
MTDRISITASESVKEGSALSVTLRFRQDDADAIPTTVKYRVDDPDSGTNLLAWTALTPAAQVSFTIPATANVCDNSWPTERREIVVMADEGLNGQYVESFVYSVENLMAVS